WEQLFYPSHVRVKSPRDRFAKSKVTHLAWTKIYADYLAAHGVPSSNIRLTGHGIYALYGQPYSSYFLNRVTLAERHGLDPRKRWVFVPENYRWAFFTDHKLRRLAGLGGGKRAELFDIRAYSQRALRAMAIWCDALAASGAAEVIIRPRPATNV